jgi:urease accessory protein
MKIHTEIVGNSRSPKWVDQLAEYKIERIDLDQWTAQKSRFVATSDHGKKYALALARQTRVADGDIIEIDNDNKRYVVIHINLNPIMVIDLSSIDDYDTDKIIRTSVEIGHAIGNQHWPAVVKGSEIYVPLTVDRKVMTSVMETHHFDNISFRFENGNSVIPYLSPHEIRQLFGGATDVNHTHQKG